jgi:hypothetical protein
MGKGIAYSKSVFYLCPTLINHLTNFSMARKAATARKKYQVFSPDGFRIQYGHITYPSLKKAKAALDEFVNGFEFQGYYSTKNRERISLDELRQRCKIVTIEAGQKIFG